MNTLYRIIVLGVALSLIGCGAVTTPTPTPLPTPTLTTLGDCPKTQLTDYLLKTTTLAGRFMNLAELAGASPRTSLAPYIREMQDIREQLNNLVPPSCATAAHTALLSGMRYTISGFIDFMAGVEKSKTGKSLDAGLTQFETATRELKQLVALTKP